jgi:ADP-L-glycero-D-manno-heptose 6-epimerase
VTLKKIISNNKYYNCKMSRTLNGKTILVTGGTGFIGANVVEYLLNNTQDSNIVVLDRSLKELNMVDNANVTYIKGLIEDKDTYDVLSAYSFDYVFHQAAVVDTTYTNEDIYDINVKSFEYLYALCLRSNASLVYASSAATYGNSPSPNIVGEGEEPLNMYGKSKLQMDMLARKYIEENKIPIVGLRYFNVFGPKENHKGNMASMIYKTFRNVENGNNTNLLKWGDQHRDFIYVKDVVQGNICAALSGKSGVYNLGTGIPRNFTDMLKSITESMNASKVQVTYIDNPFVFFQTFTQADITKTRELGYEPKYTFEQGIADYIKDYYKK